MHCDKAITDAEAAFGCFLSNPREDRCSMGTLRWLCCIAFLTGSSVGAQPPLSPPAPLPGPTSGMMSIDSNLSVNAGDTVQVIVTADLAVGSYLHLDLFWDPGLIWFSGWTPGAAMEAYANENDDCDVFVYPMAPGMLLADSLFYEEEFNSAIHGTEFLILEFVAMVDAMGPAMLFLFDHWGQVSVGSVEISAAPSLRFGDANLDGLIDLTDAVLVLDHLLGGRAIPCPRSVDVDRDASVNLTDAVYLLNTVYGGQTPLSGVCEPSPINSPLPCYLTSC